MGQDEKLGVWKPLGGEGFSSQRASDEDDVEGHSSSWRGSSERGSSERASSERGSSERIGDDDDVEGHKQKQ